MSLVFDPDAHQYTDGAARIPSVSELLRPLGGYEYVSAEIMERKSQIGRAVHLATHLDDAGELDESSVSPELIGYLDAWRLFRSQVKCQWTMSEQPLGGLRFGFAGTPDRVGSIHGEKGIVDAKCVATVMPATGVQLAAYSVLAAMTMPLRIAVQLKPDGKYSMTTFRDAKDYRCFEALLAIHQWKTT